MRAVILVRTCLGIVVASALALGPAAGAHGAIGKPMPPVDPAALAANGMEVVWQTEALLQPRTDLADLWVAEGYVIGRGSDNYVYVTSAATGVRLWSAPVAEPFQSVWPPAVDAKGDLWFATTLRLLGYQGADGKPLRTVDLMFSPSGRPVTNGTHMFVPDAKGWLQAVSITPGVSSWGRWTGESVTSGPVIDSTLVYFASQNGVVYASTQNVRRVVWEYPTEGAVSGDLAMTKSGLVLAASLDYSVYAFAGSSGRLAWRYNAGEPIRRAPFAFGNQVFVLAREMGLTALDATNGHVQWRLEETRDLVTADDTTVYAVNREGDLMGVNRADGKVLWDLPLLPGTLLGQDRSDTGILYLGTPVGAVLAAQRKKAPEEAAPKPAGPIMIEPAPEKPPEAEK